MLNKLLNHLKDRPPLWQPKKRNKYQHEITVISQKDTAVGYIIYFSSETKATSARKALEAAENAPIVLQDKKVLPNREGYYE